MQSTELEIIALTADHEAARQHWQQYTWAAPAAAAAASLADPSEIGLESETSSLGSGDACTSSATSDSTQTGELAAVGVRSCPSSMVHLHDAECKGALDTDRSATRIPAGKRRKIRHEDEPEDAKVHVVSGSRPASSGVDIRSSQSTVQEGNLPYTLVHGCTNPVYSKHPPAAGAECKAGLP